MKMRPLAAFLVLAACALAAPPAHSQRADAPAAKNVIVDVDAAALPGEARDALKAIQRGGPYPYAKDGAVFGNREARLPKQARGYYREYTVKTPGERTRGARRIVAGKGGEYYYSDDHYNSFRRIRQ
jgi:ribonuclease T1